MPTARLPQTSSSERLPQMEPKGLLSMTMVSFSAVTAAVTAVTGLTAEARYAPRRPYAVSALPETVSHLVRIGGYSRAKKVPNGKFVEARRFTVGGRTWFIRFYPNRHGPGEAGAVSVYVGMDCCEDANGPTVVANVRFSLLDCDGKPVPTFVEAMSGVDFSENDFGMKMKRRELEASGHLRGDGFTVRCELAFVNSGAGGHLKEERGVKVPPSNLHRHLADLLRQKQGGDVSIVGQGKTFTAHGWMLAARSPVMAAELSSHHDDANNPPPPTTLLRVDDDMEPEVFGALLHFIYTDTLPPDMTTKEAAAAAMAARLHVAAGRYGMERLQLMCEDALCRSVSVDTVASAVVFAENHGCRVLKRACLDLLSCRRKLRHLTNLDDQFRLLTSCHPVVKELFLQIWTTSYQLFWFL
uniref:BTB domain-containing protein n=1 Tax=Oryza brachyantha TaxID=4533 RepID=J3N7Y8_ORYBR